LSFPNGNGFDFAFQKPTTKFSFPNRRSNTWTLNSWAASFLPNQAPPNQRPPLNTVKTGIYFDFGAMLAIWHDACLRGVHLGVRLPIVAEPLTSNEISETVENLPFR
jgi:hypothetical protein